MDHHHGPHYHNKKTSTESTTNHKWTIITDYITTTRRPLLNQQPIPNGLSLRISSQQGDTNANQANHKWTFITSYIITTRRYVPKQAGNKHQDVISINLEDHEPKSQSHFSTRMITTLQPKDTIRKETTPHWIQHQYTLSKPKGIKRMEL